MAIFLSSVPDAMAWTARRLARGFVALRLAALFVPLLALIAGGVATFRIVEAEAALRVERTAGLLRENALRAFGAQEGKRALTATALAA